MFIQSHIVKFVQWAPKDASFLQQSAFRPFKVVQGHDFGTNRKRTCDFLLVRHCNYDPILHRFWDTETYWLKNCLFVLPHSHSAPPLPVFLLEFRAEVNHEETRVMGLSSSEDRMIVV